MSTCPNCAQSSDGANLDQSKINRIVKWFGFYSHCNSCDRLYFRMWDNRSLAVIILSVVLFQFLTSLVVYPILNHLVAGEVLTVVLFTLFHLACLPMYTMMSMAFMLNYR